MSSKSKSLRLNFKGEKRQKKKKSSTSKQLKDGAGVGDGGTSDVEDIGGDEQAWVAAYTATDVAGPTFFYQRNGPDASMGEFDSAAPFTCLGLNPTSLQVVPIPIAPESSSVSLSDMKALPEGIDPEDLEGAQVEDAQESGAPTKLTPQSVHHVWIANRVADSNVWTLRSAEGKFLSADKHGVVTANSDARGPLEQWDLVRLPGETPKIALKSMHGTLLGTDELAGGKKVVRADTAVSEEAGIASAAGHSEQWEVLVQWKYRHEARERARGRDEKKQKGKDRERAAESMSEEALRKSRQAWGAGKAGPMHGDVAEQLSKKELRRAEKEGRLAEAMLDLRAKQKHDKFA